MCCNIYLFWNIYCINVDPFVLFPPDFHISVPALSLTPQWTPSGHFKTSWRCFEDWQDFKATTRRTAFIYIDNVNWISYILEINDNKTAPVRSYPSAQIYILFIGWTDSLFLSFPCLVIIPSLWGAFVGSIHPTQSPYIKPSLNELLPALNSSVLTNHLAGAHCPQKTSDRLHSCWWPSVFNRSSVFESAST